MKLKSLFLALVFSFAAYAAHANNGTPGTDAECNRKNDIAGGVIHAESKKPLSNVSVTAVIGREKKVATTDNNGNYYFSDLKPGSYKVVFEKDGFRKVTRDKVIVSGVDGLQLNIEMEEVEEFQLMPGSLFF